MRALSRLGTSGVGPGLLTTALVTAVLFWVAYENGSYGLESRSVLAIALWWALIVGVVFGLVARESITAVSLVASALMAGLASWTLTSLLWSSDLEASFEEFNRVVLYLATFVFATVAVSRRTIGRWADGLALAIAGVAAVALVSRLFPGSFPEGDLPEFLPGAVTRLSFPLGYWNGLAIFAALGVPLLLRIALVARHPAVRGLALAPVPVVASVIYLASSRGGVLTAVVGTVGFLALTERRWAAAAAVVCSVLGSAAALVVLLDRDELVNGPLGTDVVEDQGRTAALLIAVACPATSAAYALGCRLLGGRVRPSATAGRVTVAAVVVAAAVGFVAADPVQRFETFKTPPGELERIERGDFVKAHLLSGGGSGRWQVWSAAIDEWQEYPVAGEGAGAYEAWWAEHGSIAQFVKDAHSLYLETLGELGVIGFALVVGLAIVGVVVGVRRSRAATGEMRVTAAALTGAFGAYAVAAGFDWVWELTAVSVLAFVVLAVLSGSGAVPYERLRPVGAGERPRRRFRFGLGVALVAAMWVLLCAQAVPLLAHLELGESRDAAARGDIDAALNAADAARAIQPWAASPYLQLSLVSEESGELRRARAWIVEALEHDRRDWRLWLVRTRIETKLGNVAAAERSLRRAVMLNPRSPLFSGLLEDAP